MEAIPIIIIIGAPVLSSMGFKFAFVENILVRIFLVAALIYSIRFYKGDSGMFSLLVLLAIVTLLIERNHVVVASLPNQSSKSKIPGPTNLYPREASQDIEANQVTPEAEVMRDERVELKEGPSNHDSPAFYKSLGLT